MTNVSIPCSGYSLTADWYENNNSDKIILALLGFSSSKARNSEFLFALGEMTGMSILAIDLSGHGDSPLILDETRPGQHLLEVIETFDWLMTQHPQAKITVLGTSYGGYLAAYLTRYRDFDKLVLRTPAIYVHSDLYSLQSRIDRDYTSNVYRKDKHMVADHPLFKQAPVFSGPTLLVVHEMDEVVPLETTDVYKNMFSAEVYVAPGFKHSMRDASNPPEGVRPYQNAVANWLIK